MALPFIFATQPTGNVPASDLDTNYNAVGALGIFRCTAAGTNSITLTPIANQPTIAAYTNNLGFWFVAAATSTSTVNIQVGSFASLPLYDKSGNAAGAGSLIANYLYVAYYISSLNGSA